MLWSTDKLLCLKGLLRLHMFWVLNLLFHVWFYIKCKQGQLLTLCVFYYCTLYDPPWDRDDVYRKGLDIGCTVSPFRSFGVLSHTWSIGSLGPGWDTLPLQRSHPSLPGKYRISTQRHHLRATQGGWSAFHRSSGWGGLHRGEIVLFYCRVTTL